MSTEVEYTHDQTTASLLSGILGDLQHLVEQQFQLTRREIEEECRQRAAAATVFGLGIAVFFLDAIVVCLTVVHLLHWMASPTGTDQAWLPLWACYSVVAVLLTVSGGGLAMVGRTQFQSVASCQNPATEILLEHSS